MIYEDDRICIPKKYLQMTHAELEQESERVYKEFRRNNPRKDHKKKECETIKLCI